MRFHMAGKKTFGHILGTLVFFLIFFLAFARVSDILREKVNGPVDMIHSFYDLEPDSLDVLVLGSSHGFCSFLPNLLWHESGVASYVMGSYRQTAAQGYYLLQEALKYQNPKLLILEGYYFFYDWEHTGEEALRASYDGTPLSRLKIDMVEDFREEMSWKEKLTYYVPFFKYHSRWNNLTDSDFNSSESWTQGAALSAKITPVITPEFPTEGRRASRIFYDYFERMVEICKERGIEMLVYVVPYTYENDTQKDRNDFFRRQSRYIGLADYMEEKGIPYLYDQTGDAMGIDFSTDFKDYSHMNTLGAIKVTRALEQYLKENYDLPDHRGEEDYASWDADYLRFEGWAEEHEVSLT